MSHRKMLTANAVKARNNNISNPTLYRWERDPDLGFPKPVVIRRRKFYFEDELEAWEARQAAAREVVRQPTTA